MNLVPIRGCAHRFSVGGGGRPRQPCGRSAAGAERRAGGVPQGNAQDQAAAGPAAVNSRHARNPLANQPAPRTADGRIVLGNTTTLKGVWIGGGLGFCNSNTVAGAGVAESGRGARRGAAAGAPPGYGAAAACGAGAGAAAPGRARRSRTWPWTRGVSDDRRRNELEPHTRCKPSGGPRQWLTPYGAEFLELAGARRCAYIFDIGGPHTYRTIYHGRPQASGEPDAELLRPLDRLVGGRHAGRGHRRLQRGLLDRSRPAPAHRRSST